MKRRIHHGLSGIWAVVFMMTAMLVAGCSSTRHVPQGEYLLDRVTIKMADTTGILNEQDMAAYLRHRENTRFLWSTKLRLGVYNLSGNDTTRWWNRWIRKLGEQPVIYNGQKVRTDSTQLLHAIQNAGFLKGALEVDTIRNDKKRKMKVEYKVSPGVPYIVNNIDYEFANDTIRDIIMSDSASFTISSGSLLNVTSLSNMRDMVVSRLRDNGYYAFGKEYVSFNADTTAGSNMVDLTMKINPAQAARQSSDLDSHREYAIRNIYVIADFVPGQDEDLANYTARDTVNYRDLIIMYSGRQYIRPSVIYESCFLRPGDIYRQRDVDNTYAALQRLTILKFINIRMLPAGGDDLLGFLDAYILLTPGRSQNINLELEGTNSEGDFGVAAGISYAHRNLGRGSETLSAKLRGSYEALNGNLGDLLHNRYMEFSAETALTFPKFKAPFLRESFKRSIKASTEFNVSMNYQERPEYTRIITTAGWSYKWSERFNRNRHIYTPIDINYVYLPQSTYDFIDLIAPDNPLLRYSYEDHFIMRMGYTFYHSNKHADVPGRRNTQRDIYTIRANGEIAGNLLFALSSLFTYRSDWRNDPYRVFGIHYSQYVKADADFSYMHIFDSRNALACNAAFGIGIPYGNSEMMPFEKRFYGGGANGVRGWNVRTLGPGRFPGTNSVSDFIDQCGDIRLKMSVEYRVKMFWVIEGALFTDVGNIWTIRDYANQPGGLFRFNSFYKELAAAYGLGIRLDFSYFLLRFDLGMKAHNPAINQEPWPLVHPDWKRDASFHFSIGYPF